jgi:ureidoacrylate peracid hydrolase
MSTVVDYAIAGYCHGDKLNEVILPAQPEALALNMTQTALIVVDMQNAYASKNGYLDKAGFDVSTTSQVITQTAKAIAAARKVDIPIVFLQNGWDKKYTEAGGPGSPNWYKSNALKTMRKQPELMGTLLAKDTWDYDFVDELKPLEGDIIIPKTRYSGFYNTNLDSMLRSRGVRNLVFTGIATNVCVESTLRDGFFLEYFGVVLADATHQAGSNVIQESALFNIATFFGWVSSVEAFCETVGNQTK